MINTSLSGANVFLTYGEKSAQIRFGVDERLSDISDMDAALQQVEDNYKLASKAFELIKNSSKLKSKLLDIGYSRYLSIEDMLYECDKDIS